MRQINTLFILFLYCTALHAQMWNGTDSIYGNEWIDYDQSYYKVAVTVDGMHRLNKSALAAAGIPMDDINGNQLQVFYMGREIPVFVSSNQAFDNDDYLEFFGERNRGDFDRYLYRNAEEEMLNPEYSLVTDTAAYFVTWTDGGSQVSRYQNINNNLTNLPTVEPFYMARSLVNFKSKVVQEAFGEANNVAYSSFTEGEGYGTGFVNEHNFDINTSEVMTGADASLILRMATSKDAHDISISFGGQNLATVNPSGYTLLVDTFTISTTALEASNSVSIVGNASNNDRTSLSNAWLIYPRAFNFSGENQFIFQVESSSADQYYEITNFNAEGQAPVLYDVTTGQRVLTALEGGVVKFRLTGTNQVAGERTLVLSSQVTGYRNATASSLDFVNYNEVDAEFIIISHPSLYNDGNGNNYVADYANYRSTAQGGGYESLVVDVQQIYDQFGYGVNRHFLSIRNFSHYIKVNWSNPQYVFIIGKGRVYTSVRTNDQLIGATTFAVPTFGSPGADNLLTARLDSDVPVIPIGRIAVSEPQDIKIYLDKIELMESGGGAQTIEDQLWKKNLLHLGGGGNFNEQLSIKNHLLSMESIIENSKFGGNVTGYYKNSSDPIQISESDDIFDRINKGVSVITFFGHSAVGTFDYNIDNPLRYENYGKYPLLVSLGCFSGNIHTSGTGVSERFVFLQDKGAIAFGAATGQGYISALAVYGKSYYQLMGEEMYGAAIGDILQQNINIFSENGSFAFGTLRQQFTLHGDPAYKMSLGEGPDYVVDTETVLFSPSVLTANLDSFTIEFSIANLGIVESDSIWLEIEQELPNGQREILINEKLKTPKYKETYSYRVNSFKEKAAGLNRLYIRVDTENDVEELPNPSAEANNELINSSGSPGLKFFIFDDSAKPIYPYEFSIVNTQNVTLKASTSDGLAPERNYVMQIDTSELFNSTMIQVHEVSNSGGVIEWNPSLPFADSTVYYWRVSPDSLSPDASYIWENSSFVYLPSEEKGGWNQSHYYQLLKNESNSITLNSDRFFEFPQQVTNFSLKNKLFETGDAPKGTMNNAVWSDFFRFDLNQSLTVVVFKQGQYTNNIYGNLYGNIWFNEKPGEYGSINERENPISSFPFPTQTSEDRENIINFLENTVPDSAYVVVYTALKNLNSDMSINDWAQDSIDFGGVNLFNLLESYGATQIRELEISGIKPYVFAFKKSGQSIYEQITTDVNGIISFELPVPALGNNGHFISKSIGPAAEWNNLFWDYTDLQASDSASLTVFGLTNLGVQDSLFTTDNIGDIDLSNISTEEYPFIQLKLNALDPANFTPVQLNRWIVNYKGLPDAAINSSANFSFYQDTLMQGETGEFEVAIQNVSDYNMDSLLLNFSIIDANNNEIVYSERKNPLVIDTIINAKLNFDTKDMRGVYQIALEANPNDDQPEQFHFNNFAIKQFYVTGDKENPILDVTFDGLHILDGDIVSPKPNIQISLKDENQFLALSDTSLFRIFLKYPNELVPKNIPIESDWINFFGASENDGNNRAYIEMRPEFSLDGVYEILVQAEDVSGNQSGDLDYKVKFEVITKSSLSNILNYPNPFSTSTQFVYTLTGDEIPEYFKIQILTVSGKIVKEITQDEIGELRVGTNRTDYRWNGTDDYGNQLANGVYLYRVIARKSDGAGFDLYESSTDSLFKRKFGKLVIMR